MNPFILYLLNKYLVVWSKMLLVFQFPLFYLSVKGKTRKIDASPPAFQYDASLHILYYWDFMVPGLNTGDLQWFFELQYYTIIKFT